MKVFVDANTLISGIVFKGPEHEVLKLVIKNMAELITSEDVIGEVFEVVKRKFPEKTATLAEFLKLSGIKLILQKDYSGIIEEQEVRDYEDKHVLAAAIESKCKFIVTGDKDLKILGKYKNIQIITSRKLLEISQEKE